MSKSNDHSSKDQGNKPQGAEAQLVELAPLPATAPFGPAVLGNNMSLLDSVEVKLSVVVGEARSTVGELMGLKEASVLKIDRHADYPVDVMLNGAVIARGQLVVVDDNFGVRITDIAAPAQP
ncbi:flagellar motor switch protein FliN [Oxalobacteraceae bacterium]|nr:flagellar motor switch protein FliN [Oxalobacteraceae bacterium]